MKTLLLVLSLLQDPTELNWLAKTVYFEARGEDIAGQVTVAHIVLARASSPDYPDTIEAVVTQDKGPAWNDCQFSWWCDGRGDIPLNPEELLVAQAVAMYAMLSGAPEGMPLHYHSVDVNPKWCVVNVRQVGRHILCLTTKDPKPS